MTWEEGRRLTSAISSSKNLSFTYDSEGLRLTKTVGSTVYHYYYAGGKLIRQTKSVSGTISETLDFFYDHNGHPYALKHTTGGVTTTYYYVTNLQGDVLSIINSSGTAVATYTYDPYGKPLTATSTLAAVNPLRYRGYVYDTETGFYYLQSRYYDPAICRFINADAFASTGQGILGNNMFAYCRNNPVVRKDIGGTEDIDAVDLDGNPLPDDEEICGGGGGGAPVITVVADGKKEVSPYSDKDNPTQSNASEPVTINGARSTPGVKYSGNFRKQLQKITGDLGEGKHAHHVFPKKFIQQFEKINIKVNDPKNGAWWEAKDHLANAYDYNKAWEMFLTHNVSATTAKIFAKLLSLIYGFDINFDD